MQPAGPNEAKNCLTTFGCIGWVDIGPTCVDMAYLSKLEKVAQKGKSPDMQLHYKLDLWYTSCGKKHKSSPR